MVRAKLRGRRYVLFGRAALQRLLDRLTLLNRRYLASVATPPLYASGVRYRREHPGDEEWLTIPEVLKRGHGDCEDLATWRAAETGGVAVPLRTRSGWHIVTRLPNGTWEDPSRVLGMGRRKRA